MRAQDELRSQALSGSGVAHIQVWTLAGVAKVLPEES
jgi:hypothetical protein